MHLVNWVNQVSNWMMSGVSRANWKNWMNRVNRVTVRGTDCPFVTSGGILLLTQLYRTGGRNTGTTFALRGLKKPLNYSS